MRHNRAWFIGCVSLGAVVGASDMLAYEIGHGGILAILALYAVIVGTLFALVFIEDYKETRGAK
jgi:hypothetical protein